MDQINVLWLAFNPDAIARGYWDQALLEDIFKQGDFEHFTEAKDIPEDEGAIVIVNGRMHVKYTEAINNAINSLKWVLFIDTGDEEAVFPWRQIKHINMRVWVQLPRMNMHDDTSFKLPNGYRTGTPDKLREVGRHNRELDYFFAGQITHARREQCRDAVDIYKEQNPNGEFIATDGFGKEAIDQTGYAIKLAQSKIVFCPSGPESPDSFRVYEALEAGCIPIVDAFATNNQDWGFWKYLFDEDTPFPVISYWSKLPEVMSELLKDYPDNANRVFAWWLNYKRKLKYKLYDDVKIIRGF